MVRRRIKLIKRAIVESKNMIVEATFCLLFWSVKIDNNLNHVFINLYYI
jgi:hypothetical protein